MALATINIRIDEKDKKEFNEICNELGMNMTTAFNMFVKSMIRSGGLPFEATLKRPNLETLMALEEAKRITKDPNVKSYNSVEEVMRALEED